MQGWNRAGVRTERIIVGDRAFDAPLVIMRSGEILPLVVRFPETGLGENSAAAGSQKHHDAADSLIDSMDLILTAGNECKKMGMEKAVDEIVKPSLELISDGLKLYGSSGREEEVQRLCVLITRQVRMGLLSLKVRRAIFGALKAENPNILYRRFTRAPTTDDDRPLVKGEYSRGRFVSGSTKPSRGGKSRRRPQGHVYEIIQGAAAVSMPALRLDQEARPRNQKEETDGVEFSPPGQSSDAFEDLCRGHLPEEGFVSDVGVRGIRAYHDDEPHLCCALPSVLPPSPPCCETELHNLFITRWEPWGAEENSAFVASAILLRDGVLICERMRCYGLNRRTYGRLQRQASGRG